MTRISLAVLGACQVELTEENEKCECFNWSQNEISSPNFSCVTTSLWIWACCPGSSSPAERDEHLEKVSHLSEQDGHFFQTAKARSHETCPGCLPAVHAKGRKALAYTEDDVSSGPREELVVSKRSHKALPRICGTVTHLSSPCI